MNSRARITTIIKRDGTSVPYDRERIRIAVLKALTAMGRPDPTLAARTGRNVESALLQTYGPDEPPTVEDIQDIVEQVLMTSGYVDVAREYIIYRHERARVRAARAPKFDVTDNIPYRIIYNVLRWNLDHDCHSVQALNRLVRTGRFPELVDASDQRYARDIETAAGIILGRLGELRIVIVAGPSSSGKTTTTIKISECLARAGIGFKAINIDHYFFNLDEHPKDEFGDYDYETPQALDLELINRHLVQLLSGQSIRTPHYDFKTGKRTLDVHPFALKPKELLLIDSLHGLYDRMTDSIPASNKFKLYIETLGQLRTESGAMMRWADTRLLRRMNRDKDHRNLGPIETLSHWHYVRRSELSHIIPFIRNADYVVNSALPYELPLFKARLFRYVSRAARRFDNDPRRLDAHIRAKRVYALLKSVRAVRDDACIPPTSLIREFIGGSAYTY